MQRLVSSSLFPLLFAPLCEVSLCLGVSNAVGGRFPFLRKVSK